MLTNIIKKNYSKFIKDKITNRNNYKMKKENFELWLDYLKSHPKRVTYENFKGFNKGGLIWENSAIKKFLIIKEIFGKI